MQVVPVEKIHHMGKGGGGRIVEQSRRALAEIAGEVPHDQPHAHAVVKPTCRSRAMGGVSARRQRNSGISG